MEHTARHLPLTRENLLRIDQEQEQDQHASLVSPSFLLLARYCNDMSTASSQAPRTQRKHRSRKHSHTSQDLVMESPRMLSFPYHNDSQFLPTVEQCQRPLTPSGTSASIASLSTAKSCGPRLCSAAPEPLITPRRAASAPPTHAQRQRQRQKRSRFQVSQKPSQPSTPWLRKLLELFTRKKKTVIQEKVELSESYPVWYSHFATNPAPPRGMVVSAAA